LKIENTPINVDSYVNVAYLYLLNFDAVVPLDGGGVTSLPPFRRFFDLPCLTSFQTLFVPSQTWKKFSFFLQMKTFGRDDGKISITFGLQTFHPFFS
jgi:hypothetical protein